MLSKIKWFACLVALVVNLDFLGALSPKDRTSDEHGFNVKSLPVDEQIALEGYAVETHHVVTQDGYILEMHRIPRGRGQGASAQTRTPVFLMHGLTGTSDSYIILGAEHSIAYNFADAGFDVWMGNARGNTYSRAHVTLDPDHNEEKFQFFDFTWEQIGMIDVPTMIDYVLEVTGHEQLHYIGHSQGGTAFLVMNSMRPEYNEKILSAHLLAGVGYMEHFPDVLLRSLAQQTGIIYNLALRLGIVELFSQNSALPDLPDWFPFPRTASDCLRTTAYEAICDAIGLGPRNSTGNDLGDVRLGEITQNAGGASTKQFAHYGQNIRSKHFRRWDFGTAAGNIEAYGSDEPPFFDISLITVDVTMHYTVADNLLDEQDVLNMVRDMPNTVARRVERETFSHFEFVTGLDAKELVTNHIISAVAFAEQMRLEGQTGSSNIISISIYLQLFILISSLLLQ